MDSVRRGVNSFPFKNNLSVKSKYKDAVVLQAQADAGQSPAGIDFFLLSRLRSNHILACADFVVLLGI